MDPRRRNSLIAWGIGLVVLAVVLAVLPAAQLVRSGPPAAPDADAARDSIRRDRAYLAGRVQLAGDKLIGLAVDPSTNTVSIELSGLLLREARASSMSVPWVVRAAGPDSIMLARLVDRSGLIPPEPIRRMEAPADTAEANRAPTTVPVETTPSATNIVLENGIVIRLDPDDVSGADRWRVRWFRTIERLRTNLAIAWDALRMRPLRTRGELRISLPGADAKAVFRALSTGSPVVIRTVGSD